MEAAGEVRVVFNEDIDGCVVQRSELTNLASTLISLLDDHIWWASRIDVRKNGRANGQTDAYRRVSPGCQSSSQRFLQASNRKSNVPRFALVFSRQSQ